MSAYTEFFLDCFSRVVQIDCIEISHSVFGPYFFTRNATDGVTVTHEDAAVNIYEYIPMKLSLSGPKEDLDHILNIQLGDAGLSGMYYDLDAVVTAGLLNELPVVKYRTYRSDDLTQPLYGPIELVVKRILPVAEGFLIEAKAPSLNVNKTGERYTLSRFPMLEGLL